MPKIFDDNFDISTDGEFFWHATTVKNVFSMIKFDAGGLKPVGTGQLGAGFYLTGHPVRLSEGDGPPVARR
jgi:hypothetical protein